MGGIFKKRGQYKLVLTIILILAIIFSIVVIAVNEIPFNDTFNESLSINESEDVVEINNTIYIPEENRSTNVIEDITGEVIEEINETGGIEQPITLKTILNLILNKISAIKGEIINIKAYLSYENETPIPDKQVDFYADQSPLASEITNEEGLAEIDWDTSNVDPGIHTISAEYLSNDNIERVISSVEVNLSDKDKVSPHETIFTNITFVNISCDFSGVSENILNKIDKSILDSPDCTDVPVMIQLSDKDKEKINSKIKKGKVKNSRDSKLVVAELDDDEIADIADTDNVIKVWRDLQTQAFLSDSIYQINADYLWNLGLNGEGIKIAVLDTGIDSSHEMLDGRVILEEDFTGTGTSDINGHGTHVSGIASGNGSYKGIAPSALLINGKVLDDSGYGQLSWLINGIDWAIDPDNNPGTDDSADVIVLSLGATYSGEPEDLLNSPEVLKVKEAVNKGITVVIASGNCADGSCGSFSGVTTPGITEEAITVGAVDKSNVWASFSSGDVISNYIKPDLVAPGVDITSSIPSGYSASSGTSMATPHVAGAVALLLQYDSSLSPLEIKSMLESSALDLGETGKDIKYGSGLVDLSNILNVSSESPVEGNYSLIIPAFVIGVEDNIIFNYKNNIKGKGKQNKKFTVVFDLEELDYDLKKEVTETIPTGRTGEFRYSWKPTLIGKHLLKIDVFNQDILLEHIEAVVDVGLGGYDYEDRLAGVNILLRW